MNEQMNKRTDICECRVAFATENFKTYKTYKNLHIKSMKPVKPTEPTLLPYLEVFGLVVFATSVLGAVPVILLSLWCFLLLRMLDDAWGCLMTLDDAWWCLMTLDDAWLNMVALQSMEGAGWASLLLAGSRLTQPCSLVSPLHHHFIMRKKIIVLFVFL